MCERGVMGSIYMKMARQVLKKLGRKNKKLTVKTFFFKKMFHKYSIYYPTLREKIKKK